MSDAKLIPGEEAIEKMGKYIASHEWWLLPCVSSNSVDFSNLIYTSFYSDVPEKFQAFQMPDNTGLLTLAMCFAKKDAMSREDLVDKLEEHYQRKYSPDERKRMIGKDKQDIIILSDLPANVLHWIGETFGSFWPEESMN